MVRFWWEISCWLWTAIFSLCPHMAWGVRELSGASFIRASILFMRAPFLWSNHLPKVHLQIPSHWGLGFSKWILEGHKQSIPSRNFIDLFFKVFCPFIIVFYGESQRTTRLDTLTLFLVPSHAQIFLLRQEGFNDAKSAESTPSGRKHTLTFLNYYDALCLSLYSLSQLLLWPNSQKRRHTFLPT